MMEKFPIPQAERLVGNLEIFDSDFYDDSFSKKRSGNKGKVITDPKEVLYRLFKEYSIKPTEGELEKSERDRELIKICIKAVKDMAAKYGKADFIEPSEDHVHFFPEGGVKELTNGRLSIGSHSTILGEIFADRRDDLSTVITIFHELWHLIASHKAIQVRTDGKLDWYRSGFSILSRDGKTEMFHHLDEALVGYATKRFVNEVLRKQPDFVQQIEKVEVDNEEINTTRQKELVDLLKYLDIIFERNTKDFSTREEILDMFMRAQVTGNLIPVARLIENTLGKGAFRELSKF